MRELKPCPFCGGEAELKVLIPRYYGATGARVFCTKCKAGTHYKKINECFIEGDTLHTPITEASRAKGEKEAVDAWNMRTVPAVDAVEVSGATKRAVELIVEERRRQIAEWGDQSDIPPFEFMSILGEEYGELCQAVNETFFINPKHPERGGVDAIVCEAVQVAAVATQIIEAYMGTSAERRNTMRLIDADALYKDGYSLAQMKWDYEPDGLPHAWTELTPLSEAPTIDAVPVVRCDECWFRPKGKTYCIELERHTGDGFYCAFGQRREDGDAR